MFIEDLTCASKPLHSQMITLSLQEQKNYYDMLHFSPLKVDKYILFLCIFISYNLKKIFGIRYIYYII